MCGINGVFHYGDGAQAEDECRHQRDMQDLGAHIDVGEDGNLSGCPHHARERTEQPVGQRIEPGGIVPWHSHGDRPAIIFIQEGEIIEYASNCAVPIVHKTGDIRPETNPTSHWWENKGSKTVVLYVGDVLHDKTDKNM